MESIPLEVGRAQIAEAVIKKEIERDHRDLRWQDDGATRNDVQVSSPTFHPVQHSCYEGDVEMVRQSSFVVDGSGKFSRRKPFKTRESPLATVCNEWDWRVALFRVLRCACSRWWLCADRPRRPATTPNHS